MASTMSGARKARGRMRLTSPASWSVRRARSRTEDARPAARSSIQRWASAIRLTSLASGGEDHQLRLDTAALQLNGDDEAEQPVGALGGAGIWLGEHAGEARALDLKAERIGVKGDQVKQV